MGVHKKEGNVYAVYAVTIKGFADKTYFGMTSNLCSRFRQHIRYLTLDIKGAMAEPRKKLYEMARKAGVKEDDVQFYIIKEGLTWDEADKLETELIRKYKTYLPEHGWNVAKAEAHAHDFVEEAIRGMPPIKVPE